MKKEKAFVFTSKVIFALAIVLTIVFINSCKREMPKPNDQTENVIKPNVVDCGPGYHWDFTLHQCVPNCQSGSVYCASLGYCIPNGQNCPPSGGGDNTITVVTNPNNPNESVGQTHNTAMDAIMPNYSSGNLEPTEQNVFAYTISYLYAHSYDTTTIIGAYNYAKQNYGPIYQMTDIASIANVMYSNGSISAAAKDYLLQLANYTSSFAADSISIPTQASYNTYANNLIANENQFSGNSSLTSNDNYILFSAYSVARYSAVYAVNYSIQISSGGGISKVAAPASTLSRWFSWKTVLGGDVVGAIGGAIGGAIVGSMPGGIGAGLGAASGAVGGAVVGSVYEAGMQVWHHLFGN
jgi:hypothetical protein